MITLARKLRVVDYFTLGWGTMVGVGWLVVMDDWLLRGERWAAFWDSPSAARCCFPSATFTANWSTAMPDAAGEVAYTAKVFPRSVSFATGWMMVLAYFIVCPWEAVAVGKIAGYIFPALDSMELYRIAGRPVYLPHVIIGLGLTGLTDFAQLSRHPPERDLSELDNFRNPRPVCRVRRGGSQQGLPAEFPTFVHSQRICFRSAGDSDCALLHDRL